MIKSRKNDITLYYINNDNIATDFQWTTLIINFGHDYMQVYTNMFMVFLIITNNDPFVHFLPTPDIFFFLADNLKKCLIT